MFVISRAVLILGAISVLSANSFGAEARKGYEVVRRSFNDPHVAKTIQRMVYDRAIAERHNIESKSLEQITKALREEQDPHASTGEKAAASRRLGELLTAHAPSYFKMLAEENVLTDVSRTGPGPELSKLMSELNNVEEVRNVQRQANEIAIHLESKASPGGGSTAVGKGTPLNVAASAYFKAYSKEARRELLAGRAAEEVKGLFKAVADLNDGRATAIAKSVGPDGKVTEGIVSVRMPGGETRKNAEEVIASAMQHEAGPEELAQLQQLILAPQKKADGTYETSEQALRGLHNITKAYDKAFIDVVKEEAAKGKTGKEAERARAEVETRPLHELVRELSRDEAHLEELRDRAAERAWERLGHINARLSPEERRRLECGGCVGRRMRRRSACPMQFTRAGGPAGARSGPAAPGTHRVPPTPGGNPL